MTLRVSSTSQEKWLQNINFLLIKIKQLYMSNPFEIGDFLKEKKISSVKDGTLSKWRISHQNLKVWIKLALICDYYFTHVLSDTSFSLLILGILNEWILFFQHIFSSTTIQNFMNHISVVLEKKVWKKYLLCNILKNLKYWKTGKVHKHYNYHNHAAGMA